MSIARFYPQGIPKAIGPYTPATQVHLKNDEHKGSEDHCQNLVFISGQIPINPETNEIDCQDIEGQTHQVMKNLCRALQGSHCNFSTVLKSTILLTNMDYFSKVNEIYGSYFGKDEYPARICYSVKTLPKNSLIQIDAIAAQEHLQKGEKPTKKVKLSNQ